MEEFLSTLNETSDALHQSIPVCETAAWKLALDEDGLKAYISKTGSTRSEYTAEVDLKRVCEAVKDYTTVKSWDPSFERHDFVMPVDLSAHIARRTFNFSGRFPVDFVYFTKEIEEESGIVLMGQSVVPPGFPEAIPPYTRGELSQYHFILRRVDDTHTKIIVVYGVELPIELPEDVGRALQDEDLRVAKRIGIFAQTWTPFLGAEVLKADVLAVENIPEQWEVLSNEGGVVGARSPGMESVISQGNVSGSIAQVLAFLHDPLSVNCYLSSCRSCTLIEVHEPKIQVLQRIFTVGLEFEYIYYTRLFELEDGSVVLVGKSLEHSDYPIGEKVRGEFVNHSYILRKVNDTTTRLTILFRFNPKLIVPLDVVHSVQTEDGKTVERINAGLGNYEDKLTPLMNEAKEEVLKAVSEYQGYEKLAGEGSVQGFRSADCKTVISIGELEYSLETIKSFVTNPNNLSKWNPGLREEQVVAFIDQNTTLYHRVTEVPTLPDVEVFFVKREYEESKDVVLIVSRSIDLHVVPKVKEGNAEVKFSNYSFYLQRISPTTTNVALIMSIIHPFEVERSLLKTIHTGDSLKLHVISSFI
jgi:hypothetical protein